MPAGAQGLTDDERGWLLDQLRDLIAACGPETFVAARVVQPVPEHFPDRWKPDGAGLQVVARRLLWHAGLGRLRARVKDARVRDPVRGGTLRRSSWAADLVDDVLQIELLELGTDDLVGILTHDIGQAYRQAHRLDQARVSPFRSAPAQDGPTDDELAEQAALGSLTTVYLGLGLLSANASHAVQHGGEVAGNVHTVEWQTTMAGGLPMEPLVFLCAVHAVVRDDAEEYRGLLPNQRDLFRHLVAELTPRRPELLRRLRLPDEDSWPAERSDPVIPFTDEVYQESATPSEVEDERWNRGRPVFRVRRHRAWLFGGLGIAVGTAGGMAIGWSWVLTSAVVTAALGFWAGRGSRIDYCSDARCGARLTPDLEVCPGCGGQVAGEIKREGERLAAEEAWYAQRGQDDPLTAEALAARADGDDDEEDPLAGAEGRVATGSPLQPRVARPTHRRRGAR
jgi:hypothetical protein